ncbi:MAG: ABC transporter permease [Bdellovibrionaceae bacterium]|nr:ABC transporter permease [Pseudobdellovibrionaceae bacterium]
MKLEAWIAWKLLFSRKTFLGGSAFLSLIGLCLGVASLVASMAVMSGFERTLREAMSDVRGHVQVIQRSRAGAEDWRLLENRIKDLEPELVAATRFFQVEGLFVHQGKISGTVLMAVDADRRDQVMNLKNRLKDGEVSTAPDGDTPGVMIGMGLAKRHSLKAGDRIRVVVPISDGYDPERFRRKVGTFIVRGVLDLGKNDWNERFLLGDLKPVQDLAEVGDRHLGLLLKFQDAERARASAFHLSQALGASYYVADWRELNQNLFEAVRLERVVIFFVVFIIVLVAAFNVTSTLFVNVLRRTDDIALMKALGLNRKSLLRIFSAQGIVIGCAGFVGGTLLGLVLCEGFEFLQSHFQVMSGAVYKVDNVRASVRGIDLLAIWFATVMVCFLATLAPAWRAARLNPTEGLRNV